MSNTNQSIKTKTIYIDKTKSLLDRILCWLKQNNIGKNHDKQYDIVWSIYRHVYDNNINIKDIDEIINTINLNEFIFREGNIWDQLNIYFKNENYVSFFKSIFNCVPIGLSTSPNAACGKGELFYRLLRPKSSQPSKGDILDNSKKIELKGCETRISSQNTTGKEYKKITDKLFKNIIKGNIPKTGGLKGQMCFEIEKHQYSSHYETEFKSVEINVRKQLFINLLKELDVDGDLTSKALSIIENGFNQESLKRILLEDWFIKYKKDNFDTLMILGDGTNVKIINDIDDLQSVVIYSDYFRINQSLNIGWYVK